jgi:hypothetical protein
MRICCVLGQLAPAPHHRLPNDVFLKLRLRVVVNDLSTAVRTRPRQRNRNLFIDAVGNRAERALSVVASPLASRRLRVGLGFPFREWRRLSLQRTQCFFQKLSQPLVFLFCFLQSLTHSLSLVSFSMSAWPDSPGLIHPNVIEPAAFVQLELLYSPINPVNNYHLLSFLRLRSYRPTEPRTPETCSAEDQSHG